MTIGIGLVIATLGTGALNVLAVFFIRANLHVSGGAGGAARASHTTGDVVVAELVDPELGGPDAGGPEPEVV